MDYNAGQHNTAVDDSDNDEVTDFLNSNLSPSTDTLAETSPNVRNVEKNIEAKGVEISLINIPLSTAQESENYCLPLINAKNKSGPQITGHNGNNNSSFPQTLRQSENNMIPTINVTPHSPANVSKYNNIFEDTLSQLQNIRESVVQMKNSSSSHINDNLSNYGLLNAAILSASLPDLSATNNGVPGTSGTGPYGIYHQILSYGLLNNSNSKSWTGIDDLTAGGDCTNKSVSLSSLDSEEQETIRVTEQRRRSARNSTGGK